MGEKTITCSCCEHNLPSENFGINPRLVHGLTPWCLNCLRLLKAGSGAKGSDLRIKFKLDYARAYATCRRQTAKRREKFLLADPATSDQLGLTRMIQDDVVRVAGPWRLYGMAENILQETFKADPDTIAAIGRGGGRGNRKQKRFRIEAFVSPDAWEVGMIIVREEWIVEEVKKLGNLS